MTALSNMAAAARPPGIGDARVPCPLCGGLIHPVAGRCKHCKEDLTSFRSGRPQAAAVLPALNSRPAVAAPVAGHGTSVHAAAPSSYAPPAAALPDAAVPILPQRTTGRHAAAEPRGSLLRNWPVLVIILAVIAIVAAVVIMVLPADRKDNGRRQLMPAPAPERMDTMPKGGDPWGPQGNNSVTPPGAQPPAGTQPRVTPDPPATPPPNDPLDPDDPLAGIDPNDPNGILPNVPTPLLMTMAVRTCQKLASCPNSDQFLRLACDQLATMPQAPIPQSCDAAQKCLAAIDNLDCDLTTSQANPMAALQGMQECARVMTDC